jgi:hypothetical protein
LIKNTSNSPSRRVVLAGGIAALAGSAAVRIATADEKLAQNIVQYQETPNDGKKCSDCVNFVAPNACKIVEGRINPNGWCVAFAPKE